MKTKEVIENLKQTESIEEKAKILLDCYIKQAVSLMDYRFGKKETPIPIGVLNGIERELDDWLYAIRRNGNDWIREDSTHNSLTKLLNKLETYNHTEPSSIDIEEHLKEIKNI